MRILVVEDELKVANLIKRVLEENAFEVTVVYDGEMGLKLAMRNHYDVVILDLILPGINGLKVCKGIREVKPQVPILMLTALNTTDDIVDGLESGANDYLTKPFKLAELIARIRALSRIKQVYRTEPEVYTYEDLTLNARTKEAQRGQRKIRLTAKEYALLELLIKNAEQPLSKSFINEHLWGEGYGVDSNVIEVYISLLRNKVDKREKVKLIHTQFGIGYVLKKA